MLFRSYLLCYAGKQYRKEFLPSKDMDRVHVMRLTWKGHEFLANASETTVWNKAMQAAGNLSFEVFSKILRDCAVAVAKSRLGF